MLCVTSDTRRQTHGCTHECSLAILSWNIHLWWNTQQEMVRYSRAHLSAPSSYPAEPSCGTGFVFRKRRTVFGAWNKSGIVFTDFDMFILDLHSCYPEWHLALLILINHCSWHSSILPVRRWGDSRSEAWALNSVQMKHCNLHQSFVEHNAAWSLPTAF